jgi:hypothetical protein
MANAEIARLPTAPSGVSAWTLSNFHIFSLTALLFLAPNALFAATALRPLPAAVVLAGCGGVGVILWRLRQASGVLSAPIDPARLALSLSLALALCLLGGEGHFFFSTWDWLTRDAVLADLVQKGPLAFYHYEGRDYVLRAPLGMYLLPAALGRLWGLFAAHIALLLQNSAIFGLILYLAAHIAKVRAAPFLLVFVFFGGLDILGFLAAQLAGRVTNPQAEWWSGSFAPEVVLQYSSFITQLFWVPNHAAPGWWLALLVLLRARGEIGFSKLLACCAPLALWSPLALLGAVPLVAFLALRTTWRDLFSAVTLRAAATGLCFLPIALYLVTDGGAITHGWQVFNDGFAWIYPFFLLIEIPQAAILIYAWRKLDPVDRGPLVVALLTLALLPLYAFGPGNDLAMRASIPALGLLAFSFARIAVSTPRDDSAFPTAISVIVLISAANPVMEIKRALILDEYRISGCNLLTSWQSVRLLPLPTNYLARIEKIPPWLMSVDGAQAPLRLEFLDCWPDHPDRAWLRGDQG